MNINKACIKRRRIIKYVNICAQKACKYYKIRWQWCRTGPSDGEFVALQVFTLVHIRGMFSLCVGSQDDTEGFIVVQ